MIWITVQFHLTVSFLNDPLPIVFGADAKASTIFSKSSPHQCFSHITTTTTQTPVQLLEHKTVPAFICIILCTCKCLPSLLVAQTWDTKQFRWNTKHDTQYEHRFAAFVPETFRSISAESHTVLLTPTCAMLNYLWMRWVHRYNDQM